MLPFLLVANIKGDLGPRMYAYLWALFVRCEKLGILCIFQIFIPQQGIEGRVSEIQKLKGLMDTLGPF